MNSTRHLYLILGIVLVLAALIVLKASEPSASEKKSGLSDAGMRDLRPTEEQQTIPNTGAIEISPLYTGRGDYHLYERSLSIPDSEDQEITNTDP